MESNFDKVKSYLLDLQYELTLADEEEGVFVINDEQSGINNLVIGLADTLVIFEQFIFEMKSDDAEVYKSLLKKNRDIIHGAFVLDDSGSKVIFRDTLQIANLDLNEVEGTLNSLGLLLSEYSTELIKFSNR